MALFKFTKEIIAASEVGIYNHRDMRLGFANIEGLFVVTGHRPAVSVTQGVNPFVHWYRPFYHITK